MHVTGTVGVTEVDQGGVYHGLLLALLQQVLQVTQVSEAASDTVPGTILVQDKHLTRCEPSLELISYLIINIFLRNNFDWSVPKKHRDLEVSILN